MKHVMIPVGVSMKHVIIPVGVSANDPCWC